MKIICCDFMDYFWIDILKSLNAKSYVFIDDISFKKKLNSKIKNFKFLEKRNCIRNLYYKEKKNCPKYHKQKDFSYFFKVSSDMINRFDPNHHFSIKEKKNFFDESVNFWLKYLKHNKINIFFSKTTPHQYYDYIIYICCKKLNIKTYFFHLNYFKDRVFLHSDNHLRNKFLKINKNINLKSESEIIAKKIIQN